MNYWLLKTEPSVFGLEDLKRRPRQAESWNGVRNYQARNFLRAMRRGDLAFLYHSSCARPGVVGVVKIVKQAYPDPTAWDAKSPYHDPKSTPETPRWFMVDVTLVRALRCPVSLEEIKAQATLKKMPLVQRGSRLSVMPVAAKEWNAILKLAGENIR